MDLKKPSRDKQYLTGRVARVGCNYNRYTVVTDVTLTTKSEMIAFHSRGNVPWFAECSCDTCATLILAIRLKDQ